MIFKVDKKIKASDFLKEKGFSRNTLPIIKYNLFNNGNKIRLIDILDEGVLELKFTEFASDIIPTDMPIDIVYEDDYILIINKPTDLCIMPNKKYLTDNLSSQIINYYNKKNIKSTVHILTRLDRKTRGLVFVVKYKELCNLFKIEEKKYLCVAEGILDDIIVEANIKKCDIGIKRYISSDGKYAKTIFKKIKQNKNTLLEANLITGRTHQIRLHLSHINHPIIGDELYGSGSNLLLQCYYLRFFHPFLDKTMEIKLEIDEEFIKYI